MIPKERYILLNFDPALYKIKVKNVPISKSEEYLEMEDLRLNLTTGSCDPRKVQNVLIPFLLFVYLI